MIPGEFYIIAKTTDYFLKKGAIILIGKKKPDKKRRYTIIVKCYREDRAFIVKRATRRAAPEIKRRAYSNEIIGLIRGCINSLIFHDENDEFDL